LRWKDEGFVDVSRLYSLTFVRLVIYVFFAVESSVLEIFPEVRYPSSYPNNDAWFVLARGILTHTCVRLLFQNYWIPHFFGSLAAGSGLAHSHVYLGKPNDTPEMVEVAMEEHKNLRAVARQVDLCPALATVLQGLDILIQERRRCCSAH
jgi:hypothetical protein